MTKILIMIILVNIAITIKSGSYDQNFQMNGLFKDSDIYIWVI